MTFLIGGIYAQSIQNAQIEFSALNTINALHEICTSCHYTCNTSLWEDCNYYLLFHIHIYHSYSIIKLYKLYNVF